MIYKGDKKIYFECGVFRDWMTLGNIFAFRLFYLIERQPEGAMMLPWKNYIGIIYETRQIQKVDIIKSNIKRLWQQRNQWLSRKEKEGSVKDDRYISSKCNL